MNSIAARPPAFSQLPAKGLAGDGHCVGRSIQQGGEQVCAAPLSVADEQDLEDSISALVLDGLSLAHATFVANKLQRTARGRDQFLRERDSARADLEAANGLLLRAAHELSGANLSIYRGTFLGGEIVAHAIELKRPRAMEVLTHGT